MPELIEAPARVAAAGTPPKTTDEFVGRASTKDSGVSIARMRSPSGWTEPGQRPEFDEFTVVLRGALRVEHEGGQLDVRAGQAVIVRRGEWVRYSTPDPEGAEYVAVCLPAFTIETAHRDGCDRWDHDLDPADVDRAPDALRDHRAASPEAKGRGLNPGHELPRVDSPSPARPGHGNSDTLAGRAGYRPGSVRERKRP